MNFIEALASEVIEALTSALGWMVLLRVLSVEAKCEEGKCGKKEVIVDMNSPSGLQRLLGVN